MQAVLQWGPPLLRVLPKIIDLAQGLMKIWSLVTKSKQDNDAVLQAMKLINIYKDDLDRLIEDPERKQQLVEGLEILMSKVCEHGNTKTGDSSQEVHGSHTFSNPDTGIKSSAEHRKGRRGLCCGACNRKFNTRQQRPLLLPKCGHTFCKSCLGEIGRRERPCCPTCHSFQDVDVENLPTNITILGLLPTEEDFDVCEKGKNDSMMNQMMSYEEEMINYALRLSLQEMTCQEERDSACSQSQEEDNISLKMARDLQEREIKWAAKSYEDEKLLRSYIYHSESALVTDGYNINCYQDSGNVGEDYNCIREWPVAGADRHGACSTKACKCSMHDDCINESCSLDNDEIDDGIDKNESCSRIDFAGSQDQYNCMPVKDEEGNMKNGFIEQHSPQELHQTPLCSETGEREHKYEEVQQYEGKKKLSKHKWRKLKEEEELNMALALSLSLQDHEQKSDPSDS